MNTTLEQVAVIRSLFEEAERRNILLWLESGWAIDARLGEITRAHDDIDIAFAGEQESAYRELIEDLGFDRHETTDYGFLSWRDDILLDSEPCFKINGEYNFEKFPAGSCPQQKQGIIDGYAVRCVSWESAYFEFLGYLDEVPRQQWRAKDLHGFQLVERRLKAEQKRMLESLYEKSR